MGLSTASVRHPHVMVMAPALTKSAQSQNFKLAPSSPTTQPTTQDERNIYRPLEGDSCNKPVSAEEELKDLGNATDNLNTLALVSELLKNNGYGNFPTIGESSTQLPDPSGIMNSSPIHMGDHKDKMGLQKTGLDVASLIKDKTTNDVDQLFNNIGAVLPTNDTGTTSGDIGQNVEDLMQVIKSIESGNDRLVSASGDLGTEADSIFPLSSTDLTSNLASFEKELFNDVDVMSISMEEQFFDGTVTLKENHMNELLSDLQRRQLKLERKLEFILRRLRKVQGKQMGQHISEEIAGVFEHVHRTLRRAKDSSTQPQVEISDLSEPKVCASSSLSSTLAAYNTVQNERLKPISQNSAKNLARKLELSSALQANSHARQRHITRYFGSGSPESSSLKSALVGAISIPQWTAEHKSELQKVAGLLQSETRLLQEELDSEATLSSSGGESCDELQTYNNPHQQYLSIQKRAAWRYATERSAIAARWTWLQAQISDLEYRIRQYSDLHKQIRSSKGAVLLGGKSPPRSVPSSPTTVNGYRGQLPGAPPFSIKNTETTANGTVPTNDLQCCRSRPLVSFRKRKLLQTWGLHAVSKKAARSSTIRCGCVPPALQCCLCTGRTDPTRPRDLPDYLSKTERISLLDPSFHPVFSLPEDASTSIHLEAIMKTPEWQHKSTRTSVKSVKFVPKGERAEKNSTSLDHQPKKQHPEHRRKYNRLIKPSTINALTAKIKNKFRGRKPGLNSMPRLKKKRNSEKSVGGHSSSPIMDNDEFDQIGSGVGPIVKLESRSSSPLLSTQTIPSNYKRSSRVSCSYDIDNIVIPYSVAASTRVERLQYKEILTPKWRMIDPDFATKYSFKNNGLVQESDQESDTEDFTEEAMGQRHDKCELDERKRFLSYLKFPYGYGRSRSHKRTDSRAESSGCNTPDPMSPHAGENLENATSPLTSPPATPLSVNTEDASSIPSINVLRRRTISQSRAKDKEVLKEEAPPLIQDNIEVPPYERRVFPLTDDTYDKMLKLMPENHQFKTNIRSQDYNSSLSYLEEERAADSPDTESTESAIGDEDPNDPEWIDLEGVKDRYNRR